MTAARSLTGPPAAPDTEADPDWRASAACLGHDPEAWFPHLSDDATPALQVCAACPVRAICAETHMYEEHGVFGGLTEQQRRRIRRARNRRSRARQETSR